MKFLKIIKSDVIITGIFLIGYGVFYYFLRDKFIFTPDFSSTDSFHFNIAYKYYLWSSIRSGIVPFWTDMINGGFPLIAESQLGILFLPYYLIFPIFSVFSHAYAFLLVFHLFILTVGMYLILKELKVPRILSFLLSVIFVWNGSLTFRWVHFTVIQAFSFTPFLFLLYLRWNRSQKVLSIFFLSLLLSQMIFAGFIQMVFISLFGLCSLFAVQNYPFNWKKTTLFLVFILCGILLSLPQILPTLQFSHYSNRTTTGSYDFAVSVPFNMNNLCSFYSADCSGSPKNATYSFDWQKDGIYWENTPYVGQLFIIITILSSIYYFYAEKKSKTIIIFLLLFLLFLLLALGKNSPLYFIFSLFPFNIFRTPPRYLLLSVFFLIIYSALILKKVINRSLFLKIFIYSALTFNCFVLIYTAYTYHLFVDSAALYQSLKAQKILKPDSLYLTYGAAQQWRKIFMKEGWNTNKSVKDYVFINQALLPNTNLITGQNTFDIYASLVMRRQHYLKSFITDELESGSNSAQIRNILDLYNITSLISFKPLTIPNFKLVQTLKEGDISIITYQNSATFSHEYYIPKTIKKIKSVEELEKLMQVNGMTQTNSLAESIKRDITQKIDTARVHINKKSDHYIESTVTANESVFIVFRKNWYPEWRLYIDGNESTIYKTNLIHMGCIVPKGTHRVELKYVPTSFYYGCILSLIVFIGMALYVLKTFKGSK